MNEIYAHIIIMLRIMYNLLLSATSQYRSIHMHDIDVRSMRCAINAMHVRQRQLLYVTFGFFICGTYIHIAYTHVHVRVAHAHTCN